MITIHLNKQPYVYDESRKTFIMSEKDIPFATTYVVLNPATGGQRKFEFTHATGAEFDPKTVWVYESEAGLKLEICNDFQMTATAARRYLNAKLRK